jgi:hypothetical protein
MIHSIYNISYEQLALLKNYWVITFDPKLNICHTDHQLNNNPELKSFLINLHDYIYNTLNFSHYNNQDIERFVHLYFAQECFYYIKVRYANPQFAKNQREDILCLTINTQIDINSYIQQFEQIKKEKNDLEKTLILNENIKDKKSKL